MDFTKRISRFNPFKPEFTMVIFIHYSRLVVDENDLKWVANEKIYCYF